MNYDLVVRPDPEAVAQAAGERVVEMAQEALERRGRFRMALSGGETPGALYRLLAAEPYRSRMPWGATEVYWGDERHLPPGDPGRNDTAVIPLLAAAGVPGPQVHPIPYVAGDPDAAARQYEAELVGQRRPAEPLLDLILLGMGTDGHTASLFPGTQALAEQQRLVVANTAIYQDRYPERITLTFPALQAIEVAMFLVTGVSKRSMLHRVLAPPEDLPFPAQRVQPASGRVLWLVDRAAIGG
jgi:6-phosphogluconolactonase